VSADTRFPGARPLGELLLDAGLITAADLDAALREQARTGGRIGQHLVLQGAVSRMAMFRAVADQSGVDFVDLVSAPPDPALLDRIDHRVLADRDWIPYRLDDDGLVIATSAPPSRDTVRQALAENPGVDRVDFVITTDWDIDQAVSRACRSRLVFSAAEELAADDPGRSAKGKPLPWQRVVAYLLMASLVAGFLLRPAGTIVAILVALNVFFLFAVLFKLFTTVIGLISRREQRIRREQADRLRVERGLPAGVPRVPDADLPVYTILVPVFHEANVVELVMDHLSQLDWPKSKLQVLILCEEVDQETVAAAKAANPPEYVRIVVVPEGTPQTKPRACNYGLLFATGDYLVIYDAEDRPDPDQLRKAHAAFAADAADPDQSRPIACLQAALNYFNWDTNLLTKMFTLEYSSWFDGMLAGMEVFRLPIPLGGTSNHFRTDRLRELGGWDPYNVTEDADLGMRVSALGYRVETIESTTWEEACSHIPAWIRQRTRWIKGYMVTALVDFRYPIRFVREAGFRSLFTLIGLIFGTPLMFLAYPIIWGVTIMVYVGFETFAFALTPLVGAFAAFNAIFGNVVTIILSMITGSVRHGWRISGYAILNPVYWFLHAYASWRALFQVFFKPHHWEKTPHGLVTGREEQTKVT
jgi:cellulose synthase/poly-beta-1,6-N-acetylglucosamine synthase-like glycosyltransferase